MPSYLIEVSYTAEAVASLVKDPRDRTEHIRNVIENLGGKLNGLWWTFGDYDIVGIYEMPDNVSAAAFSVTLTAGGAVKNSKTTPLMDFESGLSFLKKAGSSGYKAIHT